MIENPVFKKRYFFISHLNRQQNDIYYTKENYQIKNRCKKEKSLWHGMIQEI